MGITLNPGPNSGRTYIITGFNYSFASDLCESYQNEGTETKLVHYLPIN